MASGTRILLLNAKTVAAATKVANSSKGQFGESSIFNLVRQNTHVQARHKNWISAESCCTSESVDCIEDILYEINSLAASCLS